MATLINTAETAFHQGVDLYAEEKDRLIAAAELHASLLSAAPAPYHQPVPKWLCGGALKGAANASTWIMLHHHMVNRMGFRMPNVTAILPTELPMCWDQQCYEMLTHGGAFNATRGRQDASGAAPPWPR